MSTRTPTLDDVLALERTRWTPGRRELHIRHTFGLSLARYTQIANAHIDSPEALDADAELVYQLRGRRELALAARVARAIRTQTTHQNGTK